MRPYVVALPLGDIGGVGPEVLLKTLDLFRHRADVLPVLIGPRCVLEHPQLCSLFDGDILAWSGRGFAQAELVYMIDVAIEGDWAIGQDSTVNGRVSVKCLEIAVRLAMEKEVDAIVTPPISKMAWHLAGVSDLGHTPLLQRLSGSGPVSMGFYSPQLNVVLATVHQSLMSVAQSLSTEVLERSVRHASLLMKLLDVSSPKIAIAGLNPHAGEGGLFGAEEDEILKPFIADMLEKGTEVLGPFPPDIVFRQAVNGDFDVVIALYHDQGLIPVKLLAFDTAVNVTLGLPFIRTSPDHGTAFDIAYKGVADATSFRSALQAAFRFLGCET